MRLEERIRQIIEAENADFFGVADLTIAREEIERQGGEAVSHFPRAVSIGIRIPDAIVDLLPEREKRSIGVSYKIHCYDTINRRLDYIGSRIASVLQQQGYRAFPVPTAERVDDERICAIFSQKLAAHLAGLGWIGKSCLLVTPEAGPRVRFTSVLTDAPLKAGKPMETRCGDCTECVDSCPMHAFSGRNFDPAEPREARYDARKCEAYFKAMEKQGRPAVCGMCLYACPRGRKSP